MKIKSLLLLFGLTQGIAMSFGQAYMLAHKEEPSILLDSVAVDQCKYVKWWEFDSVLVPCADMYNFSWDSLNVSLPSLDYRDSLYGIQLNLVESDCGYAHPCAGEINSEFGWRHYRMHNGIDIDLEIGQPIYAAFDGVVRIAKFNYGGYGNYVMIRHYNGLETLYGHLSERLVQPNQTVRAGDIIGLGGNTGRSTGPHLHFETRYKGLPINPNKIISFQENNLRMDTLLLSVDDFKPTVHPVVAAPPVRKTTNVYYKVKSGDTLWAISKKYGTTVEKVCKLNGISRTSTLRLGQRLRVK